ncbi:MAG: TolC family protein [bacterium]|nr:TolC family protein [bacterium]
MVHLFTLLILASNKLTLDDCISIAKKNNLQIIQAKKSVEIAKNDVNSAYSSRYPDINFSSGYSRDYKDNSLTPATDKHSASVGLSYQLYNGGYTCASIEIAKIRAEIAEENYRLTEQEVILSVKQTFFSILEKEEKIKLSDKILSRRKEDYSLIKLKYNVGRESYPSVEESEVNLSQAEYDKLSAEEELKLSKVDLNLLLGRNSQTELLLKNESTELRELPPCSEFISQAKDLRPDIRIENLNHKVLYLQSKETKSEYFPKLNLSSSYGLGGSGFFSGDDISGLKDNPLSVGVSLSFPIFDGFSTKSKIKSSSLEIIKHTIKLTELEQNIESEILQAYSNWTLAKKRLELSEKSLNAIQDMYELTRLQYEQGNTTYFFFQQKEAELTKAEYNYITSLNDLQITIANLYKAGGL